VKDVRGGNVNEMAGYQQEIAMLKILLAANEHALEVFKVADNVLDNAFVSDLERVIARTRGELEILHRKSAQGLSR
jgi:hypothetical protein